MTSVRVLKYMSVHFSSFETAPWFVWSFLASFTCVMSMAARSSSSASVCKLCCTRASTSARASFGIRAYNSLKFLAIVLASLCEVQEFVLYSSPSHQDLNSSVYSTVHVMDGIYHGGHILSSSRGRSAGCGRATSGGVCGTLFLRGESDAGNHREAACGITSQRHVADGLHRPHWQRKWVLKTQRVWAASSASLQRELSPCKMC